VILANQSIGNLPEGINFVRFSPRAEAEVKEAQSRRFQTIGTFRSLRWDVGGRSQLIINMNKASKVTVSDLQKNRKTTRIDGKPMSDIEKSLVREAFSKAHPFMAAIQNCMKEIQSLNGIIQHNDDHIQELGIVREGGSLLIQGGGQLERDLTRKIAQSEQAEKRKTTGRQLVVR
jgi:hypothetical protein